MSILSTLRSQSLGVLTVSCGPLHGHYPNLKIHDGHRVESLSWVYTLQQPFPKITSDQIVAKISRQTRVRTTSQNYVPNLARYHQITVSAIVGPADYRQRQDVVRYHIMAYITVGGDRGDYILSE